MSWLKRVLDKDAGKAPTQSTEESDRQRRRSICDGCASLRRGTPDRCGHCGCVIAVLTIFNGRCPQKKW